MAEIKMPVFRSDVVFESDVTINKILTAFQIEEPIDKKIVTATYEEVQKITIKINIPSGSYSAIFNLPNNANNISVMSCIADTTYYFYEQELPVTVADTIDAKAKVNNENKTITASVSYPFPLDTEEKKYYGRSITFTLQYSYSVKEESIPNSYFNKTLLYGENGILRDIQKRLENLENNFEQLKYSNAQQNITKNDLIIDLSAGNLVLEKSEYQIQNSITTNVNKILSDINLRLREAGV